MYCWLVADKKGKQGNVGSHAFQQASTCRQRASPATRWFAVASGSHFPTPPSSTWLGLCATDAPPPCNRSRATHNGSPNLCNCTTCAPLPRPERRCLKVEKCLLQFWIQIFRMLILVWKFVESSLFKCWSGRRKMLKVVIFQKKCWM
jgi:hypothetical protein